MVRYPTEQLDCWARGSAARPTRDSTPVPAATWTLIFVVPVRLDCRWPGPGESYARGRGPKLQKIKRTDLSKSIKCRKFHIKDVLSC
jgi:hypothetical protein